MKAIEKDIIVIGSGPGGYAAAFYLADHGRNVMLVEKEDLGGVCLNRGCIPSKALLNMTSLIDKAENYKKKGIDFGKPKINIDQMRDWKQSVIAKLQGGIAALAKARKVEVVQGNAIFDSSDTIRIETNKGQTFYTFNQAIIATGSAPFIPTAMDLGNPRIMTSTEALELDDVPKELLVIGGGYIGMELGSVYSTLGSKVTVVEALDEILAGADTDICKVFQKRVEQKLTAIHVSHKVKQLETSGKKIKVTMNNGSKDKVQSFDKVLVSVGRKPNTSNIGLENTAVELDDNNCIKINAQCQTTDANIYAIGDVAGGIQLAHKATKEAKIASSSILGEEALPLADFVVPAVVFTDPEIAWVGITEKEARANKQKVSVSKFPWSASGRALTLDRTEGFTKVISDPDTGHILGVGIVGEHAGDLISEAAVAIQTGLTVDDLAETIHPHPTLSETLMESAEHALGLCTHLIGK